LPTDTHFERSISQPADLHELIRRRAEEIYYRSGCIPGRDVENWAQAEKEIHEENASHVAGSARRTAVVVRVSGTLYVGEYAADESGGYTPGEFAREAPVPVRFDGDKMFVKRPNGRELETTIVKKIAKQKIS
jgi:Protein of unknown function (DUF2934)